MKKIMAFLIGMAGCMILSGCGSNNAKQDETTVLVSKNGKITDAIVESFDSSYYSAQELQDMVSKELSEYVKLSGDKNSAVLSEFTVENQTARVYVEFATAADYASFNGVEFFYGTISEAYDKGYDMDVTLKGVEEGDTIGRDALLEMGKKHIIIVSEPIQIQTDSKIMYSTANVDIINEKAARISSESEGLAYIILK